MKIQTTVWTALVGVALAALNILTGYNHIALGLISCGLFFITTGRYTGRLLFPNESGYVQSIWGGLTLTALLSIMTTVLYYIYGITAETIFIPLLLSLLIFAKKPKKEEQTKDVNDTSARLVHTKPMLLAILCLMIDGFLFKVLLLNGTTELLVSPWQKLDAWFFIIYAVGSVLIIFTTLQTRSTLTRYGLISLHLFLGFSIAAIIYIYGFGFDGFIHRATEVWIKEYGFILPKTPYYIGQYSLIVFLSHLSSISIFVLDVFFVPLLAALTLPVVFGTVAKKSVKISEGLAVQSVWIVPFLYFLNLNLTTPHNIVLLFMIIIVLGVFSYLHTDFPVFTLVVLTLAGALTHPLLGIPLILFTVTAIVLKHTSSRPHVLWLSLCGAAIVLAPVFLFGLNNILHGYGFATLRNPLTHTSAFIELLQRPYWYAKSSPLILEAVYAWQWFIPVLTIIVGLTAFLVSKKQARSWLFFSAWISFIASAWFLRTSVTFPNVSLAEQGNYPYRLLATSVLFLLPWIAYTLVTTLERIQKRNILIKGGALLCAGLTLMLSLYFSYPQRNQKARFPGFNVTKTDFAAVEQIHNENTSYDYVVLSNILTGAAALTQYSFAQYFPTEQGELFYYSVPSGGPLAHLYGRMLYEEQKREYMVEAMNLVNVDKAYFIINSYWAHFDTIVEGAKKTADKWQSIDDGRAVIFTYYR